MSYRLQGCCFSIKSFTYGTGIPTYLSDMILSHLPTRSLRSNRSSLLNVHRANIIAALPAFSNFGPIVWNSLSKDVYVLNLFRYFVRG